MLSCKLIVMPTDLSDYSLRAIPYAVALAELHGSRLHMVYVHQPILPFGVVGQIPLESKPDEQEIYVHEELKKIVHERIPDTLDAKACVLLGNPAEEILNYAAQNNADLIVMATHGRRGFSRAMMGSTAEAVVRKASCAVLTLKQPMALASTEKAQVANVDMVDV